MKRNFILSVAALLVSALAPGLVLACACGCGVFDVQTGGMYPTGAGGTVWFEYDFMNQNRNWSGTSSAPAANNPDKDLRSDFYTLGGQYMFNRQWGVMATVPYTDRYFKTTDDSGNVAGFSHENFGDVHIQGVYSGFSLDMSTGVTFGLKVPTGDYKYAGFDRDTAISTGSTDLLLGAYHEGRLPTKSSWNWFINGQLDQPFLTTAGYRPGSELDMASGVYYDGWTVHGVRIAPIAQLLGSLRLSDRGPAASPDDSGYKRAYFAPAVEVSTGGYHVYADVALPIYQQMIGNQLVAQQLFTIRVSHDF